MSSASPTPSQKRDMRRASTHGVLKRTSKLNAGAHFSYLLRNAEAEEVRNLDPETFLFPEYLLQQFMRKFETVDKDGSGQISATEVKSLFEDLGYVPSVEEVDRLIAQVDLNANGEIDFGEFVYMTMMKMLDAHESEDDLWEAFDILDTNLDGFITAKELQQNALEILGEEISDEEVRQMILWADPSGKGEVRWEDFIQIIQGPTGMDEMNADIDGNKKGKKSQFGRTNQNPRPASPAPVPGSPGIMSPLRATNNGQWVSPVPASPSLFSSPPLTPNVSSTVAVADEASPATVGTPTNRFKKNPRVAFS